MDPRSDPISPSPPQTHSEQPQHTIISRFWTRVLAFGIDGLLLGGVGLILGLFLFDFFASLGPWSRVIGFSIALPYFSILNSSLGRGQTLGKRLAMIKVVDAGGECVSPARAFVRYLVLGVPYFFQVGMLPWAIQTSTVGVVVGLILFGLQAAVLYLYLFNRATRQSIHDVLADTYVVKASVPGRVQAGRIWKGHWVVLLGLLVVAVVISTLVAPKFMQMTPFAQLRPVLEKILDSGKVHGAQVFLGKSWGTHGESKYVHAQVTWKGRPENSEKATDEIAAIVIETYPQIMEQDLLVVTVSYGYDIGIASAWKSYTASYTPKEWQDRVKKIRVSPQQS